MVGPSWRS